MFNKDPEYAVSRFRGSWVRLKGQAEIYRVDNLYYRDGGMGYEDSEFVGVDKEMRRVNRKVKDIIFEPPRLGYVNPMKEHGEASYISRLPKREDWRQGIRPSQLVTVGRGGITGVGSEWFDRNIRAIEKTLVGDYPSFHEALFLVEEVVCSMAFHPRYAITNLGRLLYRGQAVGNINDRDRITLDQRFRFLEQELNTVVGVNHLEL